METTHQVDPVDLATQPRRAEASLGELLGEMTRELGTLLRKEVELAKVEAREEAVHAGRAAGAMAGAGVAAWLALLFISLALAWLLDQAMNTALAFLIVGVLWAAAGAVLFARGRIRLKSLRPLPETTETIKEDVEWARAQKS